MGLYTHVWVRFLKVTVASWCILLFSGLLAPRVSYFNNRGLIRSRTKSVSSHVFHISHSFGAPPSTHVYIHFLLHSTVYSLNAFIALTLRDLQSLLHHHGSKHVDTVTVFIQRNSNPATVPLPPSSEEKDKSLHTCKDSSFSSPRGS